MNRRNPGREILPGSPLLGDIKEANLLDIIDRNTRVEDVFERAKEILWEKGVDKNHDGDAFFALRTCQELGICSVTDGILVVIAHKIGRLVNQLVYADETPTCETIENNICDLINYLGILKVWLDNEAPTSIEVPEHLDPCTECDLDGCCGCGKWNKDEEDVEVVWGEQAAHSFLSADGRLAALDPSVLEGLLAFEESHEILKILKKKYPVCAGDAEVEYEKRLDSEVAWTKN